jgi:AsmA protein
MGKILKVLGWLIGMLVVLIVAAIILVPMFVDLNDHKERIVLEVKKATGRDLTIGGDIGLSVFPRFALELNGLSLNNAPGFEGGDFAAVKHAEVRVNMIPLLFSQVLEVDTVEIDGLNLNLAKSKSGVTNWDDMLGKGAKSEKAAPAEPALPDQGGNLTFTVGGVTIKDAQVVWDDQSTGERYQIANLNLETGEIVPGRSVDISFGTQLESRKPVLLAKLEMTGKLTMLDDQKVISLSGLVLKTDVTGEGLPEKGVKAELQADLRFDQVKDTLVVEQLKLISGELALSGELQGQAMQSNPQIEGELSLAKFSPRQWMKEFDLPIPQTADPAVLESLELSSHFTAGADQVELKQLLLKLDQTTVKGDLEILDFAKPAYIFNLNVDAINVDRYLPPSAEGAQPASGQSKKAGSDDKEIIPVELLRQLKLDGTVLVDSLTINKLHAEAIQLKIRGRDGKLSVDQQIGRFYDGLQKGTLAIDATGKTAQMKVTQQITRILAGPLLLDLIGDDKLLGSGDLNLNLTTQGGSVNQLKRALNGQLSFDFRDGAVKGFNLAKMIREARAKLSGENIEIIKEPEQTDFSELSGNATITNGIVNNQQLLAKSPYLRIEGSGKANLIQEDLDYTIRPVVVNTSQGQGGKGLEELEGLPIPVRIHGSWNDPQFNIQLAKVLEERQKAKLKEKLDSKLEEKLQEKVPEQLQDKLKDKLKKLF